MPLDPDASQIGFRALLEKLPAGAYTCDTEGLITYYNQFAVRLWGREPKLNHPQDRYCGSFKLFGVDGSPIAHNRCWMARALQEGCEHNGQEIVVERPDGSRATVLAHANPIHDDSGKLIGAVNVLVDISDRKWGEEAQGRLAAIVESSDDAIVSKTLDSRILSWNAGAERVFGYTAAEAIGQSILLIIPPERHDEEQLVLDRIGRGERIEHYETVRLRKDGRRIDVSLTVSPVRDSRGRVIGASKVARDVTARKQSEAALVAITEELAVQVADLRRLHEMSGRLSAMRDLTPILEEGVRTAAGIEGTPKALLFLLDPDQGRLELGASLNLDDGAVQAIQGVLSDLGVGAAPCGELRRMAIEDLKTEPRIAAHREAALRAGVRAIHSTPLTARSGKTVGVLCTCFSRLHQPSERSQRLIDLCARHVADAIENVRLYMALREADQRKDEFLATLGHELRNPLASIGNSLSLLQLTDDLSPAVESVRDIMAQQIMQMVHLVDDLLDVSRIARGKIELRKEPVELASVVKSAVETSRPLIEAASHQLALALPAEPMILDADPLRMSQVIANLLNNSAKYTERGGQIWLSVCREGSDAVISVRDTGLGIPAEMLPHVFGMFAQSDRTLNRAQGGLGIGLTLAKTLVELHGGHIEARSGGPGHGSEFVVRLPLSTHVACSVPVPAPSRARRVTFPPRRILVVDDTPASVYTLGKLLEKLGQYVRTTEAAELALEEVRIERPDIVITDIGMPNMDGYELARRLREDPQLEGLVLVALTGYGQDSDRQRAKDAGFDYHLVKPVSLDTLKDLLAQVIHAAQPAVHG